MQTKDGTVTHESFRKAWCLRSREILLSSGEEVRDGDKARFNPENQDKLFLWWRRFNRRLRALAAEHQRSGAAPLSDAELLEVMRSSNVRYLRGSKSGPFSNRRMVEEIRALALEYGRKHGETLCGLSRSPRTPPRRWCCSTTSQGSSMLLFRQRVTRRKLRRTMRRLRPHQPTMLPPKRPRSLTLPPQPPRQAGRVRNVLVGRARRLLPNLSTTYRAGSSSRQRSRTRYGT